MNSSTDVPFEQPFKPQPAAREALVQDRPTLGAMQMAKRGPGIWLLPLARLRLLPVALAAVTALAGVAVLPRLPGRPARPARRLRLARRLRRQSAQAPRASAAPAGRSSASWSPRSSPGRLAADLARRRRAARPLGRLRRPRQRLPRLDRALLRAARPAVERWVLVGDEATAERLRAYAPLREYANVVGTVPPTERGPRHRRPRRRPRGGRALPRRPRRHLQPARRRRGPAGTGPRLQVDRRPGQPAAPPARPARGASRRPRAGSAACR